MRDEHEREIIDGFLSRNVQKFADRNRQQLVFFRRMVLADTPRLVVRDKIREMESLCMPPTGIGARLWYSLQSVISIRELAELVPSKYYDPLWKMMLEGRKLDLAKLGFDVNGKRIKGQSKGVGSRFPTCAINRCDRPVFTILDIENKLYLQVGISKYFHTTCYLGGEPRLPRV